MVTRITVINGDGDGFRQLGSGPLVAVRLDGDRPCSTARHGYTNNGDRNYPIYVEDGFRLSGGRGGFSAVSVASDGAGNAPPPKPLLARNTSAQTWGAPHRG